VALVDSPFFRVQKHSQVAMVVEVQVSCNGTVHAFTHEHAHACACMCGSAVRVTIKV
jgi:hypothetical protein